MFKVWSIEEMICLTVLVVLAMIDIRKRQVPEIILVVCGIVVFIYCMMDHSKDSVVLLGGIGVGIIFLLIGRFTEEGLGYGDGWGILILGGYCGLWELLEILTWAFFLAAICAIVMLSIGKVCGKMKKHYRFPFFPFLMSGYLIVLLEEGGIL